MTDAEDALRRQEQAEDGDEFFDADWEECDTCGGDGIDGHECGEDTCACAEPDDNVICDVCNGKGGWWR